MTAQLQPTSFAEYFKPTVKTYYSGGKNFLLKIRLLIDNVTGHPRALMEIHNEVHVVFMSAYRTSILQSMDQGIISILKPYYLRITVHKATAVKDTDSSY